MAVSSRGEIFTALGADRARDLLGTPESQWLDFKRDPYVLSSERGKWELAKDVAALANSSGGLLVVGVKAERARHEVADVAVQVDGVQRALIDPKQYADVLADRLRPAADVTLHWLPDIDREQGLFFIIEVEQTEGHLIVIRRMIDEGDRPIEAFGVPRRRSDRVEWISADEVSRLIRDGLRSRLANVPQPQARRGAEEHARADQRLMDIENWQQWSDEHVYYIQGIPPEGVSLITELLEPDGLRGALENIQSLRPLGWNLRTDGRSEVRDGALAYLDDPRRAILVDADGLYTVAAVANSSYLAWARQNVLSGQREDLHPLSLVEFTFEAMRFLNDQVIQRSGDDRWTIRVVCRRFLANGGVGLRPGPMTSWVGLRDAQLATSDEWIQEFDATGSAPRDAYQALVRVYLLFGLDSTAIPYREGEAISASEITGVPD